MDPLSIIGLGMSVAGSLMGTGSKVKVPDFTPVDATSEQSKSIAGNIENFKSAQQLSDTVNSSNQDSLLNALRKVIPNYDKIVSSQSSAILSGLNGELSDPEIVAARNASAASSMARFGNTTSGQARNLTLRDLGIGRSAMVQRSLTNANNFLGIQRQTAVPNLMGPEYSMLSASARIQNAQWNSTTQYQRNLQAAQSDAQPDPMAAAAGSMLTGIGGMMFQSGGGFGGSSGSSTNPFYNPRSGYDYNMPGVINDFNKA
jgi:hypothetical protein